MRWSAGHSQSKAVDFVGTRRAGRPNMAVPRLRNLRKQLKQTIPAPVLDLRTKWLGRNQKYRDCSTTETFSEIYRERLWGAGANGEYNSGDGSSSEFAEHYYQMIKGFVEEKRIHEIVDVGCGDFRIGRRIANLEGVNYVGVDVVPDLIRYNQLHFGSSHIRFEVADVTQNDPPRGELCLVRQVLQHLSNEEIARVLKNCATYRFMIITEHVYCGAGLRLNVDISHGPDVRLGNRSGVFLEHPPFCIPTQTILEIPYAHGEVLRSVLVECRST